MCEAGGSSLSRDQGEGEASYMGVRWSLKGCAYDVTTMVFFFLIIKMSTKSFILFFFFK